jgi:hypothetical protein
MMCEYAGADYEAKLYDALPKEGGGWDTSSWFDVKVRSLANTKFMRLLE